MTKMLSIAILLTICCGCKPEVLSQKEQEERNQKDFQIAINAESQGHFETAISVYEVLLLKQPELASAHLSLARLLHDKEKDYVAAIYHYNAYLLLTESKKDREKRETKEKEKGERNKNKYSRKADMDQNEATSETEPTPRPKSTPQKTELVRTRLQMAKNILAAEMAQLADHDGQVELLLKERNNLVLNLSHSETELATTLSALAQHDKLEVERKQEVARLRQLVAEMRLTDSAPSSTPEQVKDLQEEARQVRQESTPSTVPKPFPDTDRDMITDIRADIQKMLTTPDGGIDNDTSVPKPTPPKIIKPTPVPVPPTQPKSTPSRSKHTVKPGETLSSISREYYGKSSNWKKILEANRGTINPNGRLSVGQTINIPTIR